MGAFVRLIISAAEKGANVARIIRAEEELFKLLIEEKTGIQKNNRFVLDFKTLADVLIQESLRHDISKCYPEMTNNIFGEESNIFTNSLGEKVVIKIGDTANETKQMLDQVLGQNTKAAQLLAAELHKDTSMDSAEAATIPNNFIESYADLGIWIDPIDATNEYIKGDHADPEPEIDEERIWSSGIRCVTVLIGVFELKTGTPIIGVINQPFWKYNAFTNKWQGRYFWGVSTKDHAVSSLTRYPLPPPINSKKTVMLSESEDPEVISSLKQHFNTVSASGAGYKLLCVAIGLADVYFLSKNSTHYWDTCGPHAILKSLGGDVLNFQNLQRNQNGANGSSDSRCPSRREVSYKLTNPGAKNSNFANTGGILAFRNSVVAFAVSECVVQSRK